jgi:hypothetical protein
MRREGWCTLGRSQVIAVALVVGLVAGCSSGPTPSPVSSASPTPSPTASRPAPSPTERPDPASGRAACKPAEHPEWSIARRWDEALLEAIRRALPNPPVHARNLFHLSVAMWDAWATYDPTAQGYLTTEKIVARDPDQARIQAMSFAAWGVLRSRFRNAVGGDESLEAFDAVLASLCFHPWVNANAGGITPDAVGTRIARAVLGYGLTDGSNEGGGYASPFYEPVNQPLVVASSARFELADVTHWQPLEIIGGFSQNGIPTGTVQVAVAPHWGAVSAFGTTVLTDGTPIDPGPPPMLGDPVSDATLKDMVVEVIRDSSQLDPALGTTIDVSPGARGNNGLGSNDGHGYAVNPATGLPYAPQPVNEADFLRVAAEFWADGPRSETPPGHWNVIGNDATDEMVAAGQALRIGGQGATVGRLEWDVKLYLAMNAAVHNAAIVAWGLKGKYDSIRPISLIRYMGGLGQSSDPDRPSYDPSGLPLVPGLIELVTTSSSASGQRHHGLAKHVGRIAIRSWAGTPEDPSIETSGTTWMLATAWVPYQLPSFVTPSFPGYASGHSTFSRAAAEVLTAFTGTPYFPGGLASYVTEAGSLAFEHGPTGPVALQWATYFDAADQAGQSRLFGGIHIQADDFMGRRLGSQCGLAAWQLARRYFTGEATAGLVACRPPA